MPVSQYTQTPVATDASQDAYTIRAFNDPLQFSSFSASRVDGKYFLKPVQDELLALIDSSVARRTYGVQFTCLAGDAVGDPVYLQAANTVNKADATTATKAKVVGFICHKGAKNAASEGSATTCYLVHYRYVSGLSGGTAGNPVYLSDTGSFAASAGTVAKVVGVWLSTTEAWVYASSAHMQYAQNPGNEAAGEIPFYAGAGQLDTDTQLNWDNTNKALVVGGTATANSATPGIEVWADDTARIRAYTFHASNYPRIQTARGRGTKASPSASVDGDILGIFQNAGLTTTPGWYAASAFASFCDGSPTADYVPGGFFAECSDDAGGTTKSQYWRSDGRVQFNAVCEWGGTVFSTSADTGTILKSGKNAAPSAYAAAADTDAQDFHFRTQSGGTHAAANPRGGDFVLTLGASGGGTGRAGHFRVDGISGLGNTTAPSASLTDGTLFWSADRGGAAGKAGLCLRAEDGTVHAFSDYVGLGTTSPETALHVQATNPTIMLHATVEEDADGGRESDIDWRGEQSGGETSLLARIRACHEGSSDDQKGWLKLYTNDGSDDTSPTEQWAIDSSGNLVAKADTNTYISHPGADQLGITVGGTQRFLTSNSGHPVTVTGTGGSNTGVLAIDLSASQGGGGWGWALAVINPNMVATENVIAMFGQAESSKNCGYFGFQYNANNSNSNYVTFGLYAVDHAMKVYGDAGVVVGASIGSQGAGTLNVLNDVYKNGSAYTNPDYVFERYATGRVRKYAKNARAKMYPGLRSLSEVKEYAMKHWRLPHLHEDRCGIFERADLALELIEELFIHCWKLEERLARIEA
jgi:hypothetical protein